MHIALIGASGATGRQVLQQAKEQGIKVTAIVRDPKCLDDVKHENLLVKQADIFDAESLGAAFESCDAVLSTLGARGGYKLLPWAHVTLYSESAKSIIAGMGKAGITRFIVLTSACTKYSSAHPWAIEWLLKPVFIGRIVADMARLEDYLESKECEGVTYTVVKPKGLNNGPLTDSKDVMLEEGQCVMAGSSMISRADVARAMLECLNTDQWNCKHLALGHV